MKPGDLRRTGLDLLEQQEQLKHDYVDQLKNGDLKAAEKVKNDLDENKSRLGMIEDLLNQALKIQGIAQYGGQLLGDEGAKGYDVGQYDSVENALFRAQLDTSKQINQNVTDLKTTLQTINDTTIQMRNKLDQNGGGSTYGNG